MYQAKVIGGLFSDIRGTVVSRVKEAQKLSGVDDLLMLERIREELGFLESAEKTVRECYYSLDAILSDCKT